MVIVRVLMAMVMAMITTLLTMAMTIQVTDRNDYNAESHEGCASSATTVMIAAAGNC